MKTERFHRCAAVDSADADACWHLGFDHGICDFFKAPTRFTVGLPNVVGNCQIFVGYFWKYICCGIPTCNLLQVVASAHPGQFCEIEFSVHCPKLLTLSLTALGCCYADRVLPLLFYVHVRRNSKTQIYWRAASPHGRRRRGYYYSRGTLETVAKLTVQTAVELSHHETKLTCFAYYQKQCQ